MTEKDWDRAMKAIEEAVERVVLPSVSFIAEEGPDPFRILVSTMISLRTKDEVTLPASLRLFAAADSPAAMLKLPEDRITSYNVCYTKLLRFLQMWASDSNLNDGGYSNPAYDELLDRAAEQTGTKRLKTLSESEGLLLGEGTVLPVSHQPALNVVDLSSLEGWYPNPLDIHPFKYMRFAVPELPPNVAEGSGASGKDLL